MSKWTFYRNAQAFQKIGLQNLWEGCFKMKVDHCKNQGVTRFGFEKPIVKLKVQFEKEQPSHGWRKRPGAHGQIL